MNTSHFRNSTQQCFVIAALVAALSLGCMGEKAEGWTGKPAAKRDPGTLRSVSLLIRHSAISPKYSLPKVPVEWPSGKSQLTAVGMNQMFHKGRELRELYVDKLGHIDGAYRTSEVYVRSSMTDRAMQSAQMMLLGLFTLGTGPDRSRQNAILKAVPEPGHAFNTVPVHTVALENDRVMRPWTKHANCPLYRNYVKSLVKGELYRQMGQRYAEFLNRMTVVTGANEGKKPGEILYRINEISEPLDAMVLHGMGLPEDISREDLEMMGRLADWNYHHQFLGREIGRVVGGPFVGEVVKNFQTFVKKAGKSRKYFLYSGHQRTMLGLEAALGIEIARTKGDMFEGRVPPLASRYVFELHEPESGKYTVRLKFVSDKGATEIPLPACRGECTLEEFVNGHADVIPADWRAACDA